MSKNDNNPKNIIYLETVAHKCRVYQYAASEDKVTFITVHR